VSFGSYRQHIVSTEQAITSLGYDLDLGGIIAKVTES
jgi:hypothetical protein